MVLSRSEFSSSFLMKQLKDNYLYLHFTAFLAAIRKKCFLELQYYQI